MRYKKKITRRKSKSRLLSRKRRGLLRRRRLVRFLFKTARAIVARSNFNIAGSAKNPRKYSKYGYVGWLLRGSRSGALSRRFRKSSYRKCVWAAVRGVVVPIAPIFKNIKSLLIVPSAYLTSIARPDNFKLEKSPLIYKATVLNSFTNKPFIFRNVGVFLWSQKSNFFKKNSKMKFMFKKKIYSFLFPNEVRKAILHRRKSFKSYRFVYKTSNFRKKKPYYSLVFFKNTHKDFFKLESLYKSLASNDNHLNNKSPSHIMTREEVLYEDEFVNKGHVENLRGREIFIRRIRFKPGYQRI